MLLNFVFTRKLFLANAMVTKVVKATTKAIGEARWRVPTGIHEIGVVKMLRPQVEDLN